MTTPLPLAAYFPTVSDYAEYDELRELMAEDRRRRALDAAGDTRIVLGLDGVSDAFVAARASSDGLMHFLGTIRPPLARHERRARGRRIQKVSAYVRRIERQRTQRRRATRPVIKKGLTR